MCPWQAQNNASFSVFTEGKSQRCITFLIIYECGILPSDTSDFYPSENGRRFWSEVSNANISFAGMITIALQVLQ